MKAIVLILTLCAAAVAQEYPRWFLQQDQLPCRPNVVMVMRAPSLYKDSAVALAFRTGCELLAKYTNVRISGGQTFWTTEAGVHSMGAHYTEVFDSSLTDQFQSSLKIIAAFVDKNKTIVLAGDSSACVLNDELQSSVRMETLPQPGWVEKLPVVTGYYYGVGSSEEYFYEVSSWQRAEQNAFMSLARTTHSKVVSLQKKSAIESQDLFNEDVDVQLKNVEIIARWKDLQKKIFYVLARTKQ
ncbi:MAG: LPP20 family lipoprotein [Bacteroidota bacterium]